MKWICWCILVFVALTSCARQDNWEQSQVRAGSSSFNSSKLTYATRDPINGIDLEMLYTNEKLRIYLDVRSHCIPAYEADTKKAVVRIQSPEKKVIILAHRREGGQRLLLPESSHTFILESLKKGQTLTFEVPGYKAIVQAEGFSNKFEQILQAPQFHIDFDLPL